MSIKKILLAGLALTVVIGLIGVATGMGGDDTGNPSPPL